MSSLFTDTPEDLVALRTTVEDWLEKATEAVWSFHRDDGSFWRDSKQFEKNEKKSSLTTTARAYMALACASRCPQKSQSVAKEDWVSNFEKFAGRKQIYCVNGQVKNLKEKKEKDRILNNFEISHSADLLFINNFIDRFPDLKEKEIKTTMFNRKTKAEFSDGITKIIKDNLEDRDEINFKDGQVFFDKCDPLSRHFFVTLHSLRALEILNVKTNFSSESRKELVETVTQFCLSQCFYTQRGLHHFQDPARLAFAGVIYCLYAQRVEKDGCLAIVEALEAAQQESGSWPATHPIIRQDKNPWYIATHEIALCLTWLYFQPRLPDTARLVLLRMMDKYFMKWVIPTYRRITIEEKVFYGWYDDRSEGQDMVVGWASAIVCHFLANYHVVLNDHINRRVIETLDLDAQASNYLIDETTHNRNPRWIQKFDEEESAEERRERATWFDLPPFAWSFEEQNMAVMAVDIQRNWTDPTCGGELSKKFSNHVLLPIMKSPEACPAKEYTAGILRGPPGTRKTSLVRALAKILEWPLVSVPASVIFERGFDLMETQASEVFRRLNYLTQCIIFFDEFEEFFRDRKKQKSPTDASVTPEQKDNEGRDSVSNMVKPNSAIDDTPMHDRTIAAFTTSAMLPRLQDLHDERKCLIFLATNHLENIDDAIIRPGRFDFKELLHNPKLERFTGRDGEDSYLICPTKYTLSELSIKFDTKKMSVEDGKNGKVKLERLRKAIEEALKLKRVQKQIKAFNKKNKYEDDCVGEVSSENQKIVDELRVPFRFIETALRAVESKLSETYDKRKLKKEAIEALVKSCQREMSEKGPPEL